MIRNVKCMSGVYCIPQFAEQVLKIDPNNNDSLSLIGPRLPGRNKWYGGLLGRSDGAMYVHT